MQVVNIVDHLDQVNFGIWNAALATSGPLKEQYDIDSVLVSRRADWTNPGYPLAATHLFDTPNKHARDRLAESLRPNWDSTIIVTHGAWRFPTAWGAYFAKQGLPWIYVPHGMLEPWSLEHKRFRKRFYLSAFERPWARRAHVIRAVGRPEWENLRELFGSDAPIRLIPNGIPPITAGLAEKDYDRKGILFMGRLHEKKCVARMVEAFLATPLANNPGYELLIAGPDQGELDVIRRLLADRPADNVQYLGPVFGDEKERLLRRCCFFALPSQSEGFPTSVVEAMGYGCYPLITPGCNFPEADQAGLCEMTSVATEAIAQSFVRLADLKQSHLRDLQQQCIEFIAASYTTEHLAEVQQEAYRKLLGR